MANKTVHKENRKKQVRTLKEKRAAKKAKNAAQVGAAHPTDRPLSEGRGASGGGPSTSQATISG